MNNELIEYPLSFMDALYYENKLWFFDSGVQRLCSIEIGTGDIKVYVDVEFPNGICRKVFRIDNRVYWVSTQGDISYSELGQGLQIVKTFQHNFLYEYSMKEAFFHDNAIWCIPSCTTYPIMVFDVKKEVFLELQIFTSNRSILTARCIASSLYFSIDNESALYEYDVHESKIVKWDLPFNMEIGGFDGNGTFFWLREKIGYKIHKWSKKEGVIKSYDFEIYQEQEKSELNAKAYLVNNDKVFLLPDKSHTIAYVDEKEGCLKRVKWLDDMSCLSNRYQKMFSIGNLCVEDKWILFPWGGNIVTQVNLNELSANGIHISFEENKLCFMTNLQSVSIIAESEFISLDRYIELLSNRELRVGKENDYMSVGKKIMLTLWKE